MTDQFDVEMKKVSDMPRCIKVDAPDEKSFTASFHRFAAHCHNIMHFQSFRDLQYGLQTASTFAIAALIAYRSEYGHTLATPYFLAFMAPLLLLDTAGGTIMLASATTVAFTLTCILMYVVQEPLGMGYHNYTSVSIVFLSLGFICGYIYPSITTRKIVLLLPVVYFTTLLNTQRAVMEHDFAWQLLSMSLLASTASIATAVFVFPRYACLEVQDRFAYSLQKGQEALGLATKAIMSTHKAQAEVYLCEADTMLRLMSENQEIMTTRSVLSNYEPVHLLRLLFRRHQPAFNANSPMELTNTSLAFIWHVVSLVHAARNIQFNEYHAIASVLMRDAVLETTDQYTEVIKVLTSSRVLAGCCCGGGGQDTDAINAAIVELNRKCDHMYAVINHSIKTADRETGVPSSTHASDNDGEEEEEEEEEGMQEEPNNGSEGLGDSSSSNNNNNSNSRPVRSVNGGKFGRAMISGMLRRSSNNHRRRLPEMRRATTDKDTRYEYDRDAKEGANRLPFSFFLFHLSELIHGVSKKFNTAITASTANELIASSSAINKSNVIQETNAMCLCRLFFGAIGSFLYSYVAFLKSLPADWKPKTKAGLTTGFKLGVGLIFVAVPSLARQFEHGQWILVGVLMAQGDNLGGTLYQSRNRFLGTLMGAVYGYFVYLAVGDNYDHIIAMYAPFLIIMGIIKQNRQWGYFGSIAITTGLIVSLGRNAYSDPLQGDYSLLRIQQNVLGILLSLGCSFLTIPVYATDLLKLNIVSVLDELAKSTTRICEAYQKTISHTAAGIAAGTDKATAAASASHVITGKVVAGSGMDIGTTEGPSSLEVKAAAPGDINLQALEEGQSQTSAAVPMINQQTKMLIIAYIESEGAVIRSKLAQQPLLIEQSAMELVFWSKPFPEENYQKLIACQRLVLRLVTSIDRSLLRISVRFTKVKLAAQPLKFSQRVSGLVSELLGEVLGNMSRWSSQVRATVWDDPTATAGANTVASKDGGRSGGDCEVCGRKERRSALKVTRPETRAEHGKGMERMHQVAILLAENSVRFNNETMHEWFDSLQQSPVDDEQHQQNDGVDESSSSSKPHKVTKRELTEAEIHQLFDILTTFNALFYASSHLATAAMDMGNLVFTILLLERKTHCKQF